MVSQQEVTALKQPTEDFVGVVSCWFGSCRCEHKARCGGALLTSMKQPFWCSSSPPPLNISAPKPLVLGTSGLGAEWALVIAPWHNFIFTTKS